MPGTPPARYVYLGPPGSFCEAALRRLPAAGGRQQPALEPAPSVAAALDAVRRAEADAALVPLENSVEGSVAVTLDELATGEPLQITREVLLPVAFALLARPGTDLAQVRRVATHPHAAAQCRHWLARVLPRAEVLPAASTAAAARELAAGAAYDAVIAAPFAAARYRLQVLADPVGDTAGAVTRFVLAGRPGVPPPPTGRDRTTLVVHVAGGDRPGTLLEVLTQFAVRGVNLTRIESRPTGERLGSYSFSIDCAGHVAEARIGETLAGLRRVAAGVRFLGSYPRDGRSAAGAGAEGGDGDANGDGGGAGAAAGSSAGPRVSDVDFRDAAAWVAGLREGRS